MDMPPQDQEWEAIEEPGPGDVEAADQFLFDFGLDLELPSLCLLQIHQSIKLGTFRLRLHCHQNMPCKSSQA